MTSISCFFSEFMATAVLLMVVMAVTDKKHGPPPSLVPLALFITILGSGVALGMETSYAVNPARDLGPRLFTAIVYGRQVFDFRK
jgi:aquaglyceroporin related protein